MLVVGSRSNFRRRRRRPMEAAAAADMSAEDDSSAGQTSEERIQWLRDHGVTVEIPESRKQQPSAAAAAEPEAADADAPDEETIKFKYCLIPLDEAQPYTELEAEVPASAAGDQMLKWLKPLFADGGSISADILAKQYAGTAGGGVSAAALSSVAAGGSCEAFPLVRASETNGNCGVNVYLDEVG